MRRTDKYDVFLSYNRKDLTLLRRVNQRLEERDIRTFFDDQIEPGEDWIDRLQGALKSSKTCAVFFGSHGIGSWQEREWKAALRLETKSESLHVFPVILLGVSPEEIPLLLNDKNCVNFHRGVDDDDALEDLVHAIRGIRLYRKWPQLKRGTSKWLLAVVPLSIVLAISIIFFLLTVWRQSLYPEQETQIFDEPEDVLTENTERTDSSGDLGSLASADKLQPPAERRGLMPELELPGYRTPIPIGELVIEPENAYLLINAIPWGELTGIVRADETGVDLASGRYTPFFQSLPPGRYTIHIEHPRAPEPIIKEVLLEAGKTEFVAVTLNTVDIDAYFKQAGWPDED